MTADVTVEAWDLAAERAELETLRCGLGVRLAAYRRAAGLSQPQLGEVIGKTRSTVSKIEHGTRGMPTALWEITDEACRAQGVLIAEHHALARAEADYRARCRSHRHDEQQRAAQAQLEALTAVRQPDQDVPWPQMTQVSKQLAGELMTVITKLVRSMGRREAMRVAGWALAAVGLSNLDPDEFTRVASAVQAPRRVDAQVVENLAVTLTQCKRLEDKLGPLAVLDTVIAQHQIVRHLIKGGCPEQLHKPLNLIDSNMAATIGGYLIDMGHPDPARRYLEHARRAGHDARNPAYAAFAAANASMAAFLRRDTPAALDTAAAARSLAARTNDPQLKALAEQMAAAAYAADGQHQPCLAACARAQEHLTNTNGSSPESLAYWIHAGTLDSQRSLFLCLLNKPQQAVEAASNAHARFNPTYVGSYARCQIRLGHALVLSKEITEAAHILGQAANQASLSPRLTAELHTARTLMQPWAHTPAVRTLDDQLEAYGLMLTRQAATPRLKP